MVDIVYFLAHLFDGGMSLIMGTPNPGIHPDMVWVLVIGFVAIAVHIALLIDS